MKTVISLFLLFVCPILLFPQTALEVIGYSMPEKGICAHRGANETHPENTLAAFREAILLGAQMIELDVRMTKDNELVIMHDETVNRTTNGNGLVAELTLREVKKLDAGKWKSRKFKRERVPTLKEALDIMPRSVWLNVHLKGDELVGAATAEAVVAANRIHQAVIACEEDAVKGVRGVSAELMICNMERLSTRADYIDQTREKAFTFIQLKSNRDDENFLEDVKRLKENGIYINYFHSEEDAKVKDLMEAGVDFILTDRLSKMLQAFNTLKLPTSVKQ